MQIVCAVIFLIAFTVYVASAFVSGATVFTQLFQNMSEKTAMLIFAVIIVAYTFLGGFKAVCWTDFFPGYSDAPGSAGYPHCYSGNTETPDMAELLKVYSYTDGGKEVICSFGNGLFDSSWQEIVTGLGWGLGYFGMPHIIVRFMSIEKPSMVRKSATVAIVWVILSLGAAVLVAYLGRMIVAEELLTKGAQKTVFIVLARMFFPAGISGFLLAAIIAAAVSTADSQLLVASSSFASDIYKPIFRKNASDREMLWVGRLVVMLCAIVAFLISSSKGSGAQAIMNLVENAWGIFGAAFGPVMILSYFWRRFNYAGACAGVIVGALVDIIWLYCCSSTGIYEIVPGFLCGLIASSRRNTAHKSTFKRGDRYI